jgi:uncharacterized membrane protein
MDLVELFKASAFYLQDNMVLDWRTFTYTALFVYGLYQYLLDDSIQEQARARNLDRTLVTYVLLGSGSFTITVMSGLYLMYNSIVFRQEYIVTNFGTALFLGVLQGLLFFGANICRVEARKVLPNQFVLPVTKTSILIVVVVSWFLFDEFSGVTQYKFVGLMLIGLSIYLFKDYQTAS